MEEEIRDQIAEREGLPHDSSSETSSSESEPPPAAAPPPSRAFGTVGGGARLVFQKRACSSEQSQPQSAWSGLQVETGHSLADTAAQNGVIGIKAFRNHERRLFEFGLVPKYLTTSATATGIGGKAEVLDKASVPVGIGGNNGALEFTILSDDRFHL